MNQESLNKLSAELRKLPGVGTRQAMRFARYFARLEKRSAEDFLKLFSHTRETVHTCQESRQLFYSPDAGETLSPLLTREDRLRNVLMVVLKDEDIDAIEQAHTYKGQYFVLGGFAPVIQNTPHTLPIDQLTNLITKRTLEDALTEIVLALPATPEGDATQEFLKHELSAVISQHKLTLTVLGRGMSTGLDVAYLDPITFENAFRSRN